MIFRKRFFPFKYVSDEGFWIKWINRFEYQYGDEIGVARIYMEDMTSGLKVVYLSNIQDTAENRLAPERDALVADRFRCFLEFYKIGPIEFA